jgi:hypothetical protein
MSSRWNGTAIQRAVAATCVLLIALPASFAQAPAGPSVETPDTQPAAPLLSPDELNNLVAPVALYPDPLLSQVLAASTYPLEVVEAQQWLREHRDLRGAQLMDAAKQQNWDPSVQALVAFPDALGLLANDVRWTTDLGNAFLAQQTDVMSAVQRMRERARANGRLRSTPQQTVRTETQEGRTVIEIVPAEPQVIYVPVYSPAYVWGPPVWGVYPDLWYPAGFGWGFGFGPGIYMSFFYPSWGGWGGWGWGCGWYGHSLFLNTGFFSRYGFRGGYYGGYGGYPGRGYGGRYAWMHNPGHRMGIPYPNRMVASRFNSNRFGPNGFGGNRMSGSRFSGGGRSQFNRVAPGYGAGGARSAAPGGWQHFGGGNASPSVARSAAGGFARSGNSGFAPGNRGGAGSYRQSSPNYGFAGGSRSYGVQGNRGYGSVQGYRSAPSSGRSFSPGYSAPRGGGYSAPRSSSGPRVSGGGSGFSGGHSGFSGGHSGFSGGRSGGGGGHNR